MAHGTTARFALTVPPVVLLPPRLLDPTASVAFAHRIRTAGSTPSEPAAGNPAALSTPEPPALAPATPDVTAGPPVASRPASPHISRSGTAHPLAAPQVSPPS
ncbi:MAG: hypothetical protein LBV60_11410 [Streptomyces sp.]|jgi:hypothetical protein|nr:hypothetical protein [Streptomyces sp.]